MCKDLKEYKLCTCSDKIDKKKPYWILNKAIPTNYPESPDVMGSLIPPGDGYIPTRGNLLIDLNSKNIFDFDYQPLENDVLKVFDGEFTYEFIYLKNQSNYEWDHFEYSTGFNNDKDRYSLLQKKKGFIEGSCKYRENEEDKRRTFENFD